nr:hypothetical protein CFP56_60594 [Quercus suber]
MEWVCRPEEWKSMPDGFDNTWGIVKESSESSAFQKERPSASASKVVAKGTLKHKNDGKEDPVSKKGIGTPVGEKQLKQPLPPKPSHGVGKGLMMGKGPVAQGSVHRLLTHKEHAVEIVDSIIKEIDLDPCADQATEDLGASGLFDLSRVTFDDPVPTTPGGGDTIDEEFSDSTHTKEQDLKHDSVVLAQPILDGPVASLVPSVEDPSTKNVENPSGLDAPPT